MLQTSVDVDLGDRVVAETGFSLRPGTGNSRNRGWNPVCQIGGFNADNGVGPISITRCHEPPRAQHRGEITRDFIDGNHRRLLRSRLWRAAGDTQAVGCRPSRY